MDTYALECIGSSIEPDEEDILEIHFNCYIVVKGKWTSISPSLFKLKEIAFSF